MATEEPLVVGIQSGRGHEELVTLLTSVGFSAPRLADDHFLPGVAPSLMKNRAVTYAHVEPGEIGSFLTQGLIDLVACFDDATENFVGYQLKSLGKRDDRDPGKTCYVFRSSTSWPQPRSIKR